MINSENFEKTDRNLFHMFKTFTLDTTQQLHHLLVELDKPEVDTRHRFLFSLQYFSESLRKLGEKLTIPYCLTVIIPSFVHSLWFPIKAVTPLSPSSIIPPRLVGPNKQPLRTHFAHAKFRLNCLLHGECYTSSN
jgi:hypothetical protein